MLFGGHAERKQPMFSQHVPQTQAGDVVSLQTPSAVFRRQMKAFLQVILTLSYLTVYFLRNLPLHILQGPLVAHFSWAVCGNPAAAT